MSSLKLMASYVLESFWLKQVQVYPYFQLAFYLGKSARDILGFHAAVLLLLINFVKTLCPQAVDSELFCQCYDEFAMIYHYEECNRNRN